MFLVTLHLQLFCALTLLKKRVIIKILNVGLNPTRTGFYHLLKKHGAKN